MPRRRSELTGKRFGRLTVIGRSEKPGGYWSCLCDCGNETTVRSTSLRKGGTRSCGCFKRDMETTHGDTGSPEHETWMRMTSRCRYTKTRAFHRYGGRGIKVCKRWGVYENFLADMGRRPSAKHSLDRIDNDGNYEPTNCRWATQREQVHNSSSVRLITYGGQTLCVTDWAKKIGLKRETLFGRLRKWSLEDALTRPDSSRRLLTYKGETMSVTDWAKKFGLRHACLTHRLHRGWSLEEALTKPSHTTAPRIISFRGQTMCLADWARKLGITGVTLAYRLRNWSLDDALTKPKRRGNCHAA